MKAFGIVIFNHIRSRTTRPEFSVAITFTIVSMSVSVVKPRPRSRSKYPRIRSKVIRKRMFFFVLLSIIFNSTVQN